MESGYWRGFWKCVFFTDHNYCFWFITVIRNNGTKGQKNQYKPLIYTIVVLHIHILHTNIYTYLINGIKHRFLQIIFKVAGCSKNYPLDGILIQSLSEVFSHELFYKVTKKSKNFKFKSLKFSYIFIRSSSF